MPVIPPRPTISLPVCSIDTPGDEAHCHARLVTEPNGTKPQTTATPAGYGPAQLQAAYNVVGLSSNETIAIVDAYDHPRIKADLDVYNRTFGLPPFPTCSSTITTGCFQKVNQRGGTTYPRSNAGWALEIALDVETAHAICPTCKILLVEADSNSFANLLAAIDRAISMGAHVVSNSWGAGEFSSEISYDSHFNKPGIAFTFSSGDSGYGAQYPAASPYVTAVGGTTLLLDSANNRLNETAWSGAGSGCSAYEPQPAFQTALGLSGCTRRMVADVSAVADPATGAAVYDSVSYQGRKGWFKVGGTSLAAPVVAGIYALAGNVSSLTAANGYPYSQSAQLYDITLGSNGSCSNLFLCTAGIGYDGPTGLGTPRGLGAF